MVKVNGAVFVVTGGVSGLGEGTTRQLVAHGGKVAMLDRDQEKGEALQKELGDAVKFIQVDVMEEASITHAIEAVVAHYGRIDGCVNCAGVGSARKTVDKKGKVHDIGSFEFVIRLNLIGTFSIASKCAGVMAKQEPGEDGERGVIVNVASVAAFDGQNGQAAYSASKAGVVGMSLPMARDLGHYGIRVNVIAPGIMGTPMTDIMPDNLRDSLAASQVFPNKRLGSPDDFAKLAEHIIENRFINGECIRLDAGVRMAKL